MTLNLDNPKLTKATILAYTAVHVPVTGIDSKRSRLSILTGRKLKKFYWEKIL